MGASCKLQQQSAALLRRRITTTQEATAVACMHECRRRRARHLTCTASCRIACMSTGWRVVQQALLCHTAASCEEAAAAIAAGGWREHTSCAAPPGLDSV